MDGQIDPLSLRWLLGVELSRHRRTAQLSLSELATTTGIGKPKLGHMESGRYHQAPDDVQVVLQACGVSPEAVEQLVALAGARADAKPWLSRWADLIPDFLRTYVGLIGMAERLFTFEPMIVPGLLQTGAYAQALTAANGFFRPDQAQSFAEFRQARATRLSARQELAFHTVIGEAAIRTLASDPSTRQAQLEHLIDVSRGGRVTMQVLRPDDGPHQATAIGQFALLEFGHGIRPVAYTELLDDAVFVHDLDRVRTYQWVADNLRKLALPPAETLSYLQAELAR
ncbi:helix-turn-helix domain-containing protein [Solwaraspora sp. WMMB335]|uniref:helix-turn-helix domain-containing protein n=1 Tax=Solwaraspora sp. WMMB335 TaxID=3404118 RepID=UPI003B922563